jgi:hypothetical protein
MAEFFGGGEGGREEVKHMRRPFVTAACLFATNLARSAGLSEPHCTKPNPRPRGRNVPFGRCSCAISLYFSTLCMVSWAMETVQHERRGNENCCGS